MIGGSSTEITSVRGVFPWIVFFKRCNLWSCRNIRFRKGYLSLVDFLLLEFDAAALVVSLPARNSDTNPHVSGQRGACGNFQWRHARRKAGGRAAGYPCPGRLWQAAFYCRRGDWRDPHRTRHRGVRAEAYRSNISNPEAIAVRVAGSLASVATAAAPVIWLLNGSTRLLLRMLRLRPQLKRAVTEDDIHYLVAGGARLGVIHAVERDMIEGVLDLATARSGRL
jgi:hypothetical protein